MTDNQAVVCERTVAYGEQRWRVDSQGNWSTLMWGWWPQGGSVPAYRWVPIENGKVPQEVKEALR
jgi:hypothetical protein